MNCKVVDAAPIIIKNIKSNHDEIKVILFYKICSYCLFLVCTYLFKFIVASTAVATVVTHINTYMH